MKKHYNHPTTSQPVETYACMECGTEVPFQFGVCGSCVTKISRKQAEEQVQTAKLEYERQQWIADVREERRLRQGK